MLTPLVALFWVVVLVASAVGAIASSRRGDTANTVFYIGNAIIAQQFYLAYR